jgi:sodium/hydrogen antiporter
VVLLPSLRAATIDDRSRRLIAWFGPRGLSSLLLVLLPVFAGVPGSERLFAIVALVVLLSVGVHGGGIALFLRRNVGSPPMPGGRVVSAPAAPAPAAPDEEVPERITISELRALLDRKEPVVIVDARTERSYRDDPHRARDAVRMPPDEAVRTARQLGLHQHGTLVVYCA